MEQCDGCGFVQRLLQQISGVTKHNGHKISDVANPIDLTDLEPETTYYFVVTVVDHTGESQESREMWFLPGWESPG